MGKVTSLYGKTSGKIGSIVFSTSGGETIAREYNPHVANPSSPEQVNQRAKMKLMSQLSAALSPVIAMTKEGLTSKRNKFVKRNFPACYALGGVAQITYENVQITEGNTSIPALHISTGVNDQGIDLFVMLDGVPSVTISRVAYCLFKKTQEGKLEFVDSKIANEKNSGDFGANFTYPAHFGRVPTAEYVIFGYGMSDTSERATAQYGNLNVVTASDLAKLIATRALSYQDYQFTQTRGLTMLENGTAVEPSTPGKARVYVTALGNGGTVSGGGQFDIGSEVTVVATPGKSYDFVRWLYNGTELTASTSPSYTFTLNQTVDLVAEFEFNENAGGL